MKLLKNTKEFERTVLSLAKRKPEFFYLSTFNIRIDEFLINVLKALPKNCDKRIIIGVNEDITFSKVTALKKFLRGHDIAFKITTKYHIKMLVTNGKAIVGSSNLTRSEWLELNVLIQNPNEINQLKRHYRHLYGSCKKIIKNG